jgi:beta-glucosidase
MSDNILSFPDNFLWGAATASYQIEGAASADGKGESIWDRFAHTPGAIKGGDTGDVACNHYHHREDDVKLIADLGLQAYRFSIAWPRIFPSGSGSPNQPGLDFYSRLVDNLLAAPQGLQERGGWGNRDTCSYFRDYAATVAEAFSGRVDLWITHNEPWVIAFLGHHIGIHAPGVKDLRTALLVTHHLHLSHGMAVEVLRDIGGDDFQIGIALNLSPVHPASQSPPDLDAARRYDGHLNRWFLDPIFNGEYPEDTLEEYGEDAPKITPGDLETISAPVDFLGLNYYYRVVVANDPSGFVRCRQVKPHGDRLHTAMGWEVYPKGLGQLFTRLHDNYSVPNIYITENGVCFDDDDVPDATGRIRDTGRKRFLADHIEQVHTAIGRGVPVRGYFAWSLMDNFEWACGYAMRFGLCHVDYQTLKRTPKASALWYRGVISRNGLKKE